MLTQNRQGEFNMGSAKAPSVAPIDPADSVVAAVAKEPDTQTSTAAQEQARARKRGIASSYTRYNDMQQGGNKTRLGV
jgi:hypothetical protein